MTPCGAFGDALSSCMNKAEVQTQKASKHSFDDQQAVGTAVQTALAAVLQPSCLVRAAHLKVR